MASVAMAAGLLAACHRSGSESVTIGALYPTSGPQGVQGAEEQHGVELAVQWANEHRLLGGRQLRLVTADAPRAEAVPAALSSLQSQSATVVVGTHGSTMSAVAASEATRRHLLLWETGAVGDVDTDVAGATDFIRMSPMGRQLGRAAIAFVRDELSARIGGGRALRYAVAEVDDAYGRAVGGGAVDEVRNSGLTLAGTFDYSTSGTDFGALARRIASAKPDVLFVSAYVDDGVALRQAVLANHVPLLINIGTSSSYCMPQFGARLGADAVGLFASDKPDAANVRRDALRPEGRDALDWAARAYRNRWHQEMSAPALSGFSNGYALFAHVLPAALRSGGPLPAAVAQAATTIKLPTGTLANGGGMDIAPVGAPDAGANRAAAGVIWEWVGPRQQAVVWPPAYATKPIVVPSPT